MWFLVRNVFERALYFLGKKQYHQHGEFVFPEESVSYIIFGQDYLACAQIKRNGNTYLFAEQVYR